jgi:hypothetical protein
MTSDGVRSNDQVVSDRIDSPYSRRHDRVSRQTVGSESTAGVRSATASDSFLKVGLLPVYAGVETNFLGGG